MQIAHSAKTSCVHARALPIPLFLLFLFLLFIKGEWGETFSSVSFLLCPHSDQRNWWKARASLASRNPSDCEFFLHERTKKRGLHEATVSVAARTKNSRCVSRPNHAPRFFKSRTEIFEITQRDFFVTGAQTPEGHNTHIHNVLHKAKDTVFYRPLPTAGGFSYL